MSHFPAARSLALAFLAGTALTAAPRTVHADAGPENLVLIVDPANLTSMYLANHYKAARNVPDSNVIYIYSGSTNFQTFSTTNMPAVLSELAARGITDQVDLVLVSPLDTFFVPAPGLVQDGCFPVNRFALPTCYTFSYVADEVINDSKMSTWNNRYFGSNDTPLPFDASVTWLTGTQQNHANARKYLLGTMLGWTGTLGNTPAELVSLINRSVAADGTRPAGSFYFMNNTGDSARNVRSGQYTPAVNSITALGGSAQKLNGILPPNGSQCLGIMTGVADVPFAGTSFTILPGAFCDHLTSYAATYDTGGQTKTTAWITRGASASAGTVEEPCNYTQKFPHARLHVFYYQGLTLGESWFRSVQAAPFQGLFVGDPLTRPFAYIPNVTVPDFPSSPVSGSISFTPQATTSRPSGSIATFSLFIDGVLHSTFPAGSSFDLDTALLSDGRHEIRVVAQDNSTVQSKGRFTSTLAVDNIGASTSLSATASSINLNQPVTFNYSFTGPRLIRVQLLHNGRPVAESASPSGSFTLYGANLGQGVNSLTAVAHLATGGQLVRSAPVSVAVSSTGGSAVIPPFASDLTHFLAPDATTLVPLPGAFDCDPAAATFSISGSLTNASIVAGGNRSYRIIDPLPNATGFETMTYVVQTAAGSDAGVVTLVYSPCPADWNGDLVLDAFDYDDFVSDFFAAVAAGENWADYNRDGVTDAFDYDDYVTAFFSTTCP